MRRQRDRGVKTERREEFGGEGKREGERERQRGGERMGCLYRRLFERNIGQYKIQINS